MKSPVTSVEKFRINPLEPSHRPILYGIPGRQTDGFYIGTTPMEDLYKKMVGSGEDYEKPKKVSIHATDYILSIIVKY